MQTMNASFQPADLPELREKLNQLDRADQPSVSDLLACMHDIMELAQRVASSFEEAGHLAAAATVYEDAVTAFQKASQRLPDKDRELVTPLVDYWLYAARLKRDRVPMGKKEEEPPPPRPAPTISVQRSWPAEKLIEPIRALWREEKGTITARDLPAINPGEEEAAFQKSGSIKKKESGQWIFPQKKDTLLKK